MAEPVLLHLGLRPQVLPEGGRRLRQHPGADKVIYAGYFPMGLSLERIFRDLPGVPFADDVWPKFLHGNAARVLGLEES